MLPDIPAPAPNLGRSRPSDRGFGPAPDREIAPIGKSRVRKWFHPDEAAVCAAEVSALRRAAGPGVPDLLSHGHDPDGGRSWIEMAWVGDVDLRMQVGRDGPLPTATVLDVARQTTAILERLHARGVVHGDVKPANFVLSASGDAHLIDFENARLDDDAAPEAAIGFTGGTHGYAPPEAVLGRTPDRAFDVYALGATLHFLLTGLLPPRRRDGRFDSRLLQRLRPLLPAALRTLIERALAAEPDARPPAAVLHAQLAPLVGGRYAGVEVALLAGEPIDAPEFQRLLDLRVHWRAKLDVLLERLPLTPDDLPPSEFALNALRFCRVMHLCATFLPLHPVARSRLRRAGRRLPGLLRSLPGEVQRLRQALELPESRQLARIGLDLCRMVALLNLSDRDAPRIIEATGFALQSTLERLEREEARQRTILARLDDAHARLDLTEARRILAEMLESFSGATPTTARVRDRHHRLLWLLERLAAGRDGVVEAERLLALADLPQPPPTRALDDLLARVTAAIDGDATTPHRSLSLTARVLGELSDGYPKVAPAEVTEELDQLRLALTNRVIDLLDRMAQRLELDPVPLRLLLRDLVEVDRALLLDGLADSPRMPRTVLLDELEQLRLRVEEVSDQHRRIAAGAREQIEQGRLTTALYDLERALKASPRDDRERSELRDEMEKVRQLREDLRTATSRNLQLAELRARLEGDPQSSLEERLKCLGQREEVLSFLLDSGPAPFRPQYRVQLREVRNQRLRELSDDADERLRAAADPREQERVAHDMLARLAEEHEADPSSPSNALSKRWQSYYERARRDAESLAQRERWRRVWKRVASVAAALVVVLGIGFGLQRIAGSTVEARIRHAKTAAQIAELRADAAATGALADALSALETALRARESGAAGEGFDAAVERFVAAARHAELTGAVRTALQLWAERLRR